MCFKSLNVINYKNIYLSRQHCRLSICLSESEANPNSNPISTFEWQISLQYILGLNVDNWTAVNQYQCLGIWRIAIRQTFASFQKKVPPWPCCPSGDLITRCIILTFPFLLTGFLHLPSIHVSAMLDFPDYTFFSLHLFWADFYICSCLVSSYSAQDIPDPKIGSSKFKQRSQFLSRCMVFKK